MNLFPFSWNKFIQFPFKIAKTDLPGLAPLQRDDPRLLATVADDFQPIRKQTNRRIGIHLRLVQDRFECDVGNTIPNKFISRVIVSVEISPHARVAVHHARHIIRIPSLVRFRQ